MSLSIITAFRQQQALQEQAAHLGLQGLSSGNSRHAFINARMERGADYILELIQAGKHEEAQRLLETRSWGQEELEGLEEGEHSRCHTTIAS